jgi:aspartate dehydrogenase
MSHETRATRVAVIGLGAIGRSVVAHLPPNTSLVAVLVRPSQVDRARDSPGGGVSVVSSVEELIASEPDVVAECAGQDALAELAEPVLAAGIDLVAVSTGALADDDLRTTLAAAAARSGARLIIPAGAIAGLDGLGALRLSGIDAASYTSIKPPRAWLETPAEQIVDLESLRERTEFFSGDARKAARLFPKNANLAVTVALAAGGFDRTTVRLVADPDAIEIVGIVAASGPLGTLHVELRGPASPDNARTSAITAFSIVHALERRTGTVVL